MAVKLYDPDLLGALEGLYYAKAMEKIGGDMEVYSTLLDKFLNQLPLSASKLRTALRNKNLTPYVSEMHNLRMDLADIFALQFLKRATVLENLAEQGDFVRCVQSTESFLSALQSFAYDLKQCRTQEGLQDQQAAAAQAANLDIGRTLVNSRYAIIPKKKFYELYRRIDTGELRGAINLSNVLRAMDYPSQITDNVCDILRWLNYMDLPKAKKSCQTLIELLGGTVPTKE